VVCSRARQAGDHRSLHKLGGGSRRTGRARKYPFLTNNLPENLMSKSSQLANATLRRYGVPEHALRIDARDGRGSLPEGSTQTLEPSEAGANSVSQTRPAVAQADPTWSVLWVFLEGFALYGASLHGLGTTAVTAITNKVGPRQRRKPAWSERQKSISFVSPSARPEITVVELEDAIDRTAFRARIPSTTDGFASPARNVDRYRFVHPDWLAMIWRAIASRWAKWHREREIRKAVAALVEFDDRTLRDVGIPHRSQIEQALRDGRDGLM
jgi:hypothetical protein